MVTSVVLIQFSLFYPLLTTGEDINGAETYYEAVLGAGAQGLKNPWSFDTIFFYWKE